MNSLYTHLVVSPVPLGPDTSNQVKLKPSHVEEASISSAFLADRGENAAPANMKRKRLHALHHAKGLS